MQLVSAHPAECSSAAENADKQVNDTKKLTILVAVDFSYCARIALRKARELIANQAGSIVVLYVIDSKSANHFFHRNHIQNDGKRKIFQLTRKKLKNLLKEEQMSGSMVKTEVCEGEPYTEINKKVIEHRVDRVVLGSWAPYFTGARRIRA